MSSNAVTNSEFPYCFEVVRKNPTDKEPSLPFHDISIEEIKEGKVTDKLGRLNAYQALYTFLRDEDGYIPLVGDKSVLASLLARDIIEIENNSLKFLKPLEVKIEQELDYSENIKLKIVANPNYNKSESNIYATRTWGFHPESWPLITFSKAGNRDSLLRKAKAGDLIIFVGTQGEPTDEIDRGKILGVAEIGKVEVDALSVLQELGTNIRDDFYDGSGNFKWPYAMLMTRAWRFKEQPFLTDLFDKQLPMNARNQAVILGNVDSQKIRGLDADEVEIPSTTTISKLRNIEKALLRGKPSVGLIPSSWSGKVDKNMEEKSYTYGLRFGKENCWKVGHSKEPGDRVNSFNKNIPFKITKNHWKKYTEHPWQDSLSAYEMEQRFFKIAAPYSEGGEMVYCDERTFKSLWSKAAFNL